MDATVMVIIATFGLVKTQIEYYYVPSDLFCVAAFISPQKATIR
jgi:hypothetical protein